MSTKKETIKDNSQLHDEIEDIPSNTSGNTPFASVLETNMSRRNIMKGSLGVAAASFLAPAAHAGWGWEWGRRELVDFRPVAIDDVVDTSMPTISDDYEYQILIPWGTPIEPGATQAYTGDPDTRPTSAQAALQTGLGHDGMWFFPVSSRFGHHDSAFYRRNNEGMLCVNHEYGNNSHALGKDAPENLEDVRLSQNIHGVSVVKIKRSLRGDWRVISSNHSRRITVNTPVAFSGPAADSELLQNPNGNIPLGTVNNCGSGATPWGTYLTCEENFNGYFGATGEFFSTAEQERYGFSNNGFGYGWHHFDKRFDLSDPDYVNEQNRFGWIVEIDPFDGTQKPVKRTALGRFKHEAIAIAESHNGRIAAYMGDDQRFDYCYKYVSNKSWRQAISDRESPLDNGSLYVAKFNDDGTGEWLELTIDNPVLASRFNSQAEVLIYARIASDLLGATPMDRPEWTTIGKDGEVFWTCTNNSNRTESAAANPEAPNNDGHIIRTRDADDHLGTTFVWDIYILASSTRGAENVFTDPDAAWADPYGRLFIGTDGGQPDGLQDQLVVFDTTKEVPEPKRLLVGVSSDEITGFTITPDQRTAFVNIQHPGNGSPRDTNFPAPYDGSTIPRDCTLVITRKNGGIIGS
ncbi:PhoX family protein [Pleionea sediminis]|uniref:PhoX family protein n=1 Tax=Pleionea sediminis TaxID=2569479 RepID=UPI001185A04A|nr:PhoX family phosphatase [Pleionea sediminis]